MYVLWGDRSAAGDRLRDALVGDMATELLGLGDLLGLSVDVADGAADIPSPVPTPEGEDPHLAVVSTWLACHDRRGPAEEVVYRHAAAHGLQAAGYLVSGAVYTEYGETRWAGQRSWPDGERSPSVLTVALIHQPAGLDRTEWFARWHGVQSPVSTRLQPRIRYVRNEVIRPLTEAAPEVGGIVEEAWPSAEHITDPMLFFNADGDPDRMAAHLTEMMDSVSACLDLERLRSTCMSEYLLRTVP